MMSLGLHLRIIGRPGRIGALQRVLDHAGGRKDVWAATRSMIAAAYADAAPPPQEQALAQPPGKTPP